MAKTKTIDSGEIHAAFDHLAAAISTRHASTKAVVLLGIANGGVEVARRLTAGLAAYSGLTVKTGVLDISFHRDDIGRNPIPKELAPTYIPVDVNGAAVILVDDVLFTGRTVKAALDELFDHGRPARVELAVLIDRGGHRLPVAADYVGLTLNAADGEKVIVRLNPASPTTDIVRIETAALKPTVSL